MAINTKQKLFDYAKRRLGWPVIHLELDEDQIEDRFEDCLEFFHEFHFDGTQEIYLKHQVTQDDIDQRSVPVPENIIGINRIMPFKNSIGTSNASYVFNPAYQIVANELYNLNFSSIVYYSQVQEYISLLNFQLRAVDSIRFNRKMNRVYSDFDWNFLEPGDFLVFDCLAVLDPEEYPEIYNDRLFKELFTAYVKRQWGANLKKFDGVQMIGGITISGQQIFDEANTEIAEIEDKIRNGFELPPIGYLG